MKDLGLRKVAVARLNLPGDILDRVGEEQTTSMAASIDRVGLLHNPICRRIGRGLKLLAGRTRVAAFIKLQRAEIQVRVIECSDLEAQQIELIENFRRRNYEPSTVAEMRALIDSLAAQVDMSSVAQPTRGTRISRRTAAMREAAKLTGYSMATVRSLVRRAKAEAEGAPVNGEPASARLMPIGMTLSASFMADIAMIQSTLSKASSRVAEAMSVVRELSGSGRFPSQWLTELLEGLVLASKALKGRFPTSLCPYCRGLPGVRPQCAACIASAWIGAGQVDDVPDRLWDTEDMVVMKNGEPIRVEEA